MDFRHLAAQETAALLADLLGTHVARTSTELQALRHLIDALDAELRDGRTATVVSNAAEQLAERLSQAAREETEAARATLRGEAAAALSAAQDSARAEHERLTHSVKQLRQTAEQDMSNVRGELHARTAALEATTEELAGARKLAEAAGAERESARREAAQLKKQIEAASGEHAKVLAALDKAKTLLKDTEAERRALAGQLAAATVRLEVVERANEEHEGIHLALQARLEAAAATVAALNREVEDAHAKAARARRDAEAAAHAASRDQIKRTTQARMHQVVSVLQRIGASVTLSDALGALVEGLATEFSRVALFRVSGNRLEGVHQIRLDFESDISNVVIPLTMDSLLAQAVGSGRIEGFPVTELAERGGAPFGGTPAFVLAMPIVVRDGVAAVIYADDSDQPEASADATTHKRTFAALLWEFAAPQLSRLSSEVKELTELRNYATLLLDEIEYVYQADETAGRRGDDLRNRLADNLECARRIYAQRVAAEGPAAARLLDEQLTAMIASKAETGFADDLLAVSGQPVLPGRETAEAS
jgi:hypothetical protein